MTGVVLWQLTAVSDILRKLSSVSFVLVKPRSHNTGTLLELTSWLHKAKSFLRTNISSASQENFHILWDLKVHRLIHNSRSPVPVLNQINPAHKIPFYFSNANFIIILSSILPNGLVSLNFPTKTQHELVLLPLTCQRSCLSHTSWSDTLIKDLF